MNGARAEPFAKISNPPNSNRPFTSMVEFISLTVGYFEVLLSFRQGLPESRAREGKVAALRDRGYPSWRQRLLESRVRQDMRARGHVPVTGFRQSLPE